MEDDLMLPYPNTPKDGENTTNTMKEKIRTDFAPYESIELPAEPSPYGGKQGTETFEVGNLPLELRYRLEDSALKGGDSVVKTMKWYTSACEGSGIFDADTVKSLKSLTAEVEQAAGYQGKKAVLEEKVYPFLRSITIKNVLNRRK